MELTVRVSPKPEIERGGRCWERWRESKKRWEYNDLDIYPRGLPNWLPRVPAMRLYTVVASLTNARGSVVLSQVWNQLDKLVGSLAFD